MTTNQKTITKPAVLSQADSQWLEQVWTKLQAKMSAECDRVGDRIPYIAEDGVYKEDKAETDIYWWTNGFWPGMLWQMYHATGEEKYRTAAESIEKKMDVALEGFEELHHDVGFMWLHTAVANYRLTGNAKSRVRGLNAASVLAGRYNPRGNFIRAWNGEHRLGWVIIDCMMNIPLLYWASRELNDPSFSYIAKNHADTVLKHTIREEGSSNHIIILDPDSGELVNIPDGQGYSPDSSWSRGQSWALYGYALSYRHTGDTRYLDAAKRIAHYFIANVSLTGFVPLVDFKAPAEPVVWDTTAGMCAACGLLEIADSVGELEKPLYLQAALKILQATEQGYGNWNVAEDGIIGNGTAGYHIVEDNAVPIIYADYFFIEAVLRLQGKDFLIW